MPTPRFSGRTAFNLEESELASTVRTLRHSGSPFYDLTLSNPTLCGFAYQANTILSPLIDERALVYDPDPLGLAESREAIAKYYADHGAVVSASQILITTSTSEGYGHLFRLLCDAGDKILVPEPGYPLFDFLGALDHVEIGSYPLFEDHGWHIDLAALEERITKRTRAIVVVHPNNPTGHFTSASDREAIKKIASRRGIALIVDEVFLDYAFEESADVRSFLEGDAEPLTFVLSGLSKIAGLPQMKAAWIAACGPTASRTIAMSRLELIADTYLYLNAPIQIALPTWLARHSEIQGQIRARVAANLCQLDGVIGESATLRRLPVEGGWSAVLRVPAIERDRDLAAGLAATHGVIVHPGSFYGLPERGRLVVSLLGPEQAFESGLKLIGESLKIDSY